MPRIEDGMIVSGRFESAMALVPPFGLKYASDYFGLLNQGAEPARPDEPEFVKRLALIHLPLSVIELVILAKIGKALSNLPVSQSYPAATAPDLPIPPSQGEENKFTMEPLNSEFVEIAKKLLKWKSGEKHLSQHRSVQQAIDLYSGKKQLHDISALFPGALFYNRQQSELVAFAPKAANSKSSRVPFKLMDIDYRADRITGLDVSVNFSPPGSEVDSDPFDATMAGTIIDDYVSCCRSFVSYLQNKEIITLPAFINTRSISDDEIVSIALSVNRYYQNRVGIEPLAVLRNINAAIKNIPLYNDMIQKAESRYSPYSQRFIPLCRKLKAAAIEKQYAAINADGSFSWNPLSFETDTSNYYSFILKLLENPNDQPTPEQTLPSSTLYAFS